MTEVLTGRMQSLPEHRSTLNRFLLFMLVRLAYVALAIYFGPFVTLKVYEFGLFLRDFEFVGSVI